MNFSSAHFALAITYISKNRRIIHIRRHLPYMKRMRSDARYTVLLVARGDDDDEFRREDVAPSEYNSTAYSRWRKKPACSSCGETMKTPIAATDRLTIPLTGREVGQRVDRVSLSASQLSTRPRETS